MWWVVVVQPISRVQLFATPWIEGVYSERRNGQMQRHEINVKTEMNNLLTEFNFQ